MIPGFLGALGDQREENMHERKILNPQARQAVLNAIAFAGEPD